MMVLTIAGRNFSLKGGRIDTSVIARAATAAVHAVAASEVLAARTTPSPQLRGGAAHNGVRFHVALRALISPSLAGKSDGRALSGLTHGASSDPGAARAALAGGVCAVSRARGGGGVPESRHSQQREPHRVDQWLLRRRS